MGLSLLPVWDVLLRYDCPQRQITHTRPPEPLRIRLPRSVRVPSQIQYGWDQGTSTMTSAVRCNMLGGLQNDSRLQVGSRATHVAMVLCKRI